MKMYSSCEHVQPPLPAKISLFHNDVMLNFYLGYLFSSTVSYDANVFDRFTKTYIKVQRSGMATRPLIE